MNRIPSDAFSAYVGMGHARSYQAIADKYNVTKRAVAKAAKREEWPKRLAEIEQKARDDADRKLKESISEMNVRHLQVMKFIQAKAIDALKSLPLNTAMEAIRAYGISLEKERLIRGEPMVRTEISVMEATRRELDRFLANDDEPDEGADDEDDPPEAAQG